MSQETPLILDALGHHQCAESVQLGEEYPLDTASDYLFWEYSRYSSSGNGRKVCCNNRSASKMVDR